MLKTLLEPSLNLAYTKLHVSTSGGIYFFTKLQSKIICIAVFVSVSVPVSISVHGFFLLSLNLTDLLAFCFCFVPFGSVSANCDCSFSLNRRTYHHYYSHLTMIMGNYCVYNT
jgi:hypothetical protein